MISLIEYLWLALGVYWLLSAARSRATKASESRLSYWLRIGLLVVLFEFLFSSWGRLGWLGRRFLPATTGATWTGLVVVLVGLGLAAWARHCLGANWSSAVMLKQDHELITRGPYRWIRHPIYTGIAVGVAGTAVVIGEWRGIVALLAIACAHVFKARSEESLLEREFGESFRAHRRRTGMFLPRRKPEAAALNRSRGRAVGR